MTNDLLIPGDQIFLIIYLDHAETSKTLDEIRQKPFVLWCIGKITNLEEDDPFYVVISSGHLYHERNNIRKEIVVKGAIISKEIIFEYRN